MQLGKLIDAIHSIWNEIGHDVESITDNNETAIEMCLDADRLEQYPEAKEQWEVLRSRFTYEIARRVLSDVIKLL